MINDIAEGIFKGILKIIFWLFVEVLLFYTGEIVLAAFSFGTKKPRWDYYADESGAKFVIFTEISTYVGITFWLFVCGFVAPKLINS